jgi:protein-S-isoprenylcysteine O-methyltransferase Ste14
MTFAFSADAPSEIAFLALLVGWLGFAVILAVGKKGAAKGAAKRDTKSSLGFLLQCASYAICFTFHRPFFSPFAPMSKLNEQILAAITILLTAVSVWFCWAAARALGKQWALVARVIEGHELISVGPYSVVRNPIYLAMLGMLIASGFATALWQALPFAILVFLIGTAIRIRTEENLLREAFGPRFADYARRVPAFFPRVLR